MPVACHPSRGPAPWRPLPPLQPTANILPGPQNTRPLPPRSLWQKASYFPNTRFSTATCFSTTGVHLFISRPTQLPIASCAAQHPCHNHRHFPPHRFRQVATRLRQPVLLGSLIARPVRIAYESESSGSCISKKALSPVARQATGDRQRAKPQTAWGLLLFHAAYPAGVSACEREGLPIPSSETSSLTRVPKD